MDAVARLEDTEIMKVLVPTISAFIPLLEEKRTLIKGIPMKTFTYGSTPRHQLDVYYPPEPATGSSPVLFFVYGGGFTTGERTLPAPSDLAYANVATYFAQKGFISVIPDYRLVPHVTFPGPPEDIRDAVKWVVQNLNKSSDEGLAQADTNSIFLAGHSAGAVHVSTTLLYPGLTPNELKQRVKGLILLSGAYHLHPAGQKSDFVDLMNIYWGGEEEAKKNVPLALLENVPESDVASIPNLLLVEGEKEPDWLKIVGEDFHQESQKKIGIRVEKVIAKGHNHISLSWALGSGQGEEWAETAVRWMQKNRGQ